MTTVARITDSLIKLYLLLHLAIGVLLDSQSVLPRAWYPDAVWGVVDQYVAKLGDNLVRTNPPWFVALVWMEVLLQLPMTVALLYGYAARRKFIRPLGIIYAVHVLTTMPPILYHFETTMPVPHKFCVYGVYAPWVVMPAIMLLRFACGSPRSAPRRRSASGSGGMQRAKKA